MSITNIASNHSQKSDVSEGKASQLPAPAFAGYEATDAYLILEGGAMRGQFTAGVLDFFSDQHLFFKNVVGVSAGALSAFNYVAGMPGRTCRLNVSFGGNPKYLSLFSFFTTGNACGREFCFDVIPNKLDLFDFEAFENSPMTMTSVSTNLETGEAEYHTHRKSREELDYVIASSSMPLVSQIVEVDGLKLLDGGTSDSIPVEYAQKQGAKKIVVVLTQHDGYVKEPNSAMPLMNAVYSDYPYYLERVKYRHIEYNRTYRKLKRMHENGEIFVIRPPKPVTVKSMEKDPEKLFELWEEGLNEAAQQYDKLLAYLAK